MEAPGTYEEVDVAKVPNGPGVWIRDDACIGIESHQPQEKYLLELLYFH